MSEEGTQRSEAAQLDRHLTLLLQEEGSGAQQEVGRRLLAYRLQVCDLEEKVEESRDTADYYRNTFRLYTLTLLGGYALGFLLGLIALLTLVSTGAIAFIMFR